MLPPTARHRWRLSSTSAVTACGLAALCAWMVRQPLWHTDLWGHLAYGRLISRSGRLPVAEPFLPFSSDAPLVDTAWLSQLAGYSLFRLGGPALLQWTYALLVTAAAAAVLVPAVRRGDRLLPRLAAAGVFLAVGWQQLAIVRPQLVGLACFAGLLALVDRPVRSRTARAGLVVMFALWANLHGSFVMGLLLLVTCVLGRTVDRWRRTGHWTSLKRDRTWRVLVEYLVLATLAVMVTPYGTGLPEAVLEISRHPNLKDLVEWQPLGLEQSQARIMIVAVLFVLVVLWRSSRRVTSSECLLFLGLGVAAVVTSRMITWWAPVVAWLVARHLSDRRRSGRPPACHLAWTAVTALAVGLAIVMTPATWSLLRGQHELGRAVSRETPVAAVEWLKRHPPQGPVFNLYEWGDYLVWAGIPEVQPLVNSHAHLLSTSLWQDYLAVIDVEPGWQATLDQYGVETVLLDHRRLRGLAASLEADSSWRSVYRDAHAEIWLRE